MIKIIKIIKAAFSSMIIFYLCMWWFGFFITGTLFPRSGDPVIVSYVHPIYWAAVLLSGLIVGCTVYLAELIKKSNPKD